MLSIVTSDQKISQDLTLSLDEIARQGAKRMLMKALQHEVAENMLTGISSIATTRVRPLSYVTAKPSLVKSPLEQARLKSRRRG